VKNLRYLEGLAWGRGFLLLTSYAAVRVHGELMKRQELARFAEARREAQQAGTRAADLDRQTARFAEPLLPPNRNLWSSERMEAYEESLHQQTGLPLAVLRIPGIDLEVPVLDGTDDLTLNRAVGRIEGTARIGETGNVGIAGHRDGFFRGLKDVTRGDVIELVTLDQTETYVVEQTWIVDPESVGVLDSTTSQSITLVTCYPFYYVGSAPRRFVVRAVRSDRGEVAGT
jgi:sortase A